MKKFAVVLFIFVLAFSVRILFILNTPRSIESDEIAHDRLATGLVTSVNYTDPEGNPTSYRPPLYPAFLALIYSLFGHNLFIARTIQALVGSITVCLLFLIARKIFNKKTALLTGIFSSFYMTFVISANLLYAETLFAFMLVLITFLTIAIDKPHALTFCVLGTLCGFLALIRSSALLLPSILVFALWLKMRKENLSLKKRLASCLILIICFLTMLLPWSIRNYKVHGRLVLVSTNGGVNLYQGVCWSPGRIFNPGAEGEAVWREVKTIKNEAVRNDFFIRQAISIYKTRPLFILKMLPIRFLFFWNIIDWDIIGGDKINFHFIFILPFAILGTIYSLKEKKTILVPLSMILYFSSFTLVFPAMARYRMPVDGFVIMLGSYGILEFIDRQRKKIPAILWTTSYFFLTYLLYRYSVATKCFVKNIMEHIGWW